MSMDTIVCRLRPRLFNDERPQEACADMTENTHGYPELVEWLQQAGYSEQDIQTILPRSSAMRLVSAPWAAC